MLKVIPPTTSCECGYFKTKCAEIHYLNSNFSILCIFCGMKICDYGGFAGHFQKMHLKDFTKTLQCTAEPIVTPVCKMKKSDLNHDPLEFHNRELTVAPDEVMQKSKQKRKYEEVKIEILDNSFFTADHNGTKKAKDVTTARTQTDESAESDNEFLFCTVKVEEAVVTTPLNGIKSEQSRKHDYVDNQNFVNDKQKNNEEAAKGAAYEKTENCLFLFSNPISDDRIEYYSDCDITCDDDNDDSFDIMKIGQHFDEDVDWSTPYEPKMLKHYEKRPYKPRNKSHMCSYCGRTFKRRYQMETHFNIHTGEKPNQCEICGLLFRADNTLTRHLKTHKKEPEALQCKFCRKAFTHKVALISHEMRHTQKRTVACNECDKWFYTANQMDTHKRQVHNKSDQDDLPFACDICPKSYRSSSMLSQHKFKKHYKMAKYSCNLCSKKFVTEEQSTTHQRIHIGNFSYQNTSKPDGRSIQNLQNH